MLDTDLITSVAHMPHGTGATTLLIFLQTPSNICTTNQIVMKYHGEVNDNRREKEEG